MGVLVNGEWRVDGKFPADPNGPFRSPRYVVPQLDHAGRRARADRRGRVSRRAGALPSLCLARLPLGASHADLPQAQGTGRDDRPLGRQLVHGRRRLDLRARPGVVPDRVNGAKFLHEIYVASKPDYTGRVSVPVLWDKQTGEIVNNESADIIRMFNRRVRRASARSAGRLLSRSELREEIDALNARIYATVNNGVYRCGFARSQDAYDEAVAALFETLDMLEARLATRRFLCGERVTEADWRLFVTLLRFDRGLCRAVQMQHPAHRRLSQSARAISRELLAWPGVEETIDMFHIKHHYYESLKFINPTGDRARRTPKLRAS